MSKSESWKGWLLVIGVLIFSGLMTALWPTISGNLMAATSSAVSAPRMPVDTITIPPLPLPFHVPFVSDGFTLTSIQALLGIGFFVVGGVAVTGIIIAVVNLLLSRWTSRVETSESYLEGTAALEQREKAELAAAHQAQPAATTQQHDYSRWAVAATWLAILFFAAVAAYMFASAIFPASGMVLEDDVVNIVRIITVGVLLLTLLYLFFRMDKERLVELNNREDISFTWDTIAVIALGALVVGLGIGFLVYLNLPG